MLSKVVSAGDFTSVLSGTVVNNETEQPTVSARDLHEKLEIVTPFHIWFPRMAEYGFEEGKDFSSKMSESTGGRPSTDYDISIDMAKEICMLQRTEKGKQCRQYFIQNKYSILPLIGI